MLLNFLSFLFFSQFVNHFHLDYLIYPPLCVHVELRLEFRSSGSFFPFVILILPFLCHLVLLSIKAILKGYIYFSEDFCQGTHEDIAFHRHNFPCVIEVVHYGISLHASFFPLSRDHLEKGAYCN